MTAAPALSNNFQQVSSSPQTEIPTDTPQNDAERKAQLRKTLEQTQQGKGILKTLDEESIQIAYEDMPECLKGYYIHGNRTIYLNKNLPQDFDDFVISNEVAHVRQMSSTNWDNLQMPDCYIMTSILFEGDSFVKNMDYLYATQKQGRDLSVYLSTNPTSKELFSIYAKTMKATNEDKNKAAHALIEHWVTSPSALQYMDICFFNLENLMSHREYFIQKYDLDGKWDASALPVGTIYDYVSDNEIDTWYKQLTSTDNVKFQLTSIQSRIDMMVDTEEKVAPQAVDKSPPPP